MLKIFKIEIHMDCSYKTHQKRQDVSSNTNWYKNRKVIFADEITCMKKNIFMNPIHPFYFNHTF